ncbi:DUF932 domain-containing protein [Arthrobacter rhombi]|uniref:DUF932 domain-containing protein n=1 Tax=Arthrobacter rhombi TaxID=71253 RepID=UPI003FD53ADD
MAHKLEVSANGSAAFFAARKSAWHRLGVVTEEAQAAEHALQLAHLDGWDVHKEPLQTVATAGDELDVLTVPDKFATVRTHPFTGKPDVLGVVGKVYSPIQNEEHCDLLNALVDASGAHFETAGSLRGGREVFVTMKLPEHMKVGGVDDVDMYIAALNSHDGSSPFRLMVTPIRVVCANTQAAALQHAKGTFNIRHTRSAMGHIEQARQALSLTFRYQEEFQAAAERMIQESLTDAAFGDLVERLMPTPSENATNRVKDNHREKADRLEWLFADAPTNDAIRGTRWAGYQAVTEFVDHYAPAKLNRYCEDVETARSMAAIGTAATSLKHRAFDLLAV